MSSAVRIVQKRVFGTAEARELWRKQSEAAQKVVKGKTLEEVKKEITTKKKELRELEDEGRRVLSIARQEAQGVIDAAKRDADTLMATARVEVSAVKAKADETLASAEKVLSEVKADEAALKIRIEAQDRKEKYHAHSKGKLAEERQAHREIVKKYDLLASSLDLKEQSILEGSRAAERTKQEAAELLMLAKQEREQVAREISEAKKAQADAKRAEATALNATRNLQSTEREFHQKELGVKNREERLKADEKALEKKKAENREETKRLKGWEQRLEVKAAQLRAGKLVK